MVDDQFYTWLANVLRAIQAALVDRHVEGAIVDHDAGDGLRHIVHVVISVGDKSHGEYFEAEQLDDCGQAIDAPAALKVRMLVGHFVALRIWLPRCLVVAGHTRPKRDDLRWVLRSPPATHCLA